MIFRKKKITRRKRPKKKGATLASILRLSSLLLLLIVLVFSVATVGYVIFFRTVFAQEILPKLKSAIVFEEPDPPVLVEMEPALELEWKNEVGPPPESVPVLEREPETGPEREIELVEEEAGVPEVDAATIVEILPKVAIIIDDMGYHDALGRELLALPFEMTYSFLPFAPYTNKLEWLAYTSGKTVFLHLPLQPKGNEWDPGPGALTLADSPEVQKAKLDKCLEEVPHAVGINNHMGSLFTEDEVAMTRLIMEINGKALFFVDSYTSSDSVGFKIAQDLDVQSARRDVFLDNILNEKKICHQLEKLILIAEKNGVGIGIAHPHRETLAAISSCGELYRTRVRFVGISDLEK